MHWLDKISDLSLKWRLSLASIFLVAGVPFLFSPIPQYGAGLIVTGVVVVAIPALLNLMFEEKFDDSPLETSSAQKRFVAQVSDDELEGWLSDFASLFPKTITSQKVADMTRLARHNPRGDIRRFNYAVEARGQMGSLSIKIAEAGPADFEVEVQTDPAIYQMLPVAELDGRPA
jgi:hypothetical protein